MYPFGTLSFGSVDQYLLSSFCRGVSLPAVDLNLHAFLISSLEARFHNFVQMTDDYPTDKSILSEPNAIEVRKGNVYSVHSHYDRAGGESVHYDADGDECTSCSDGSSDGSHERTHWYAVAVSSFIKRMTGIDIEGNSEYDEMIYYEMVSANYHRGGEPDILVYEFSQLGEKKCRVTDYDITLCRVTRNYLIRKGILL